MQKPLPEISMLGFVRFRQILRVIRLRPFDQSSEFGRSQERYRLIILSSSSSLVSKFFTAMMGLVSIRLSIDYLGKEQYGLWMVVTSLVVFLQVADFGIINGLTNAIAEAHGRSDREAASRYISSAVAATAFASLICLLPVILFSLWLPWDRILNMQEAGLLPLAQKCFLVSGIVFIFGLPVSVINRVFVGFQLGYIANLFQIVSSVCALIGLIAAIQLRLSLPWLVLLVSSGPVIGNLLLWLLLPRFLPWCRLGRRLINRAAVRRVARSSVPLFFFQIGALLTNQMVNVVVAQVGTLEMVADYNIILKFYLLIFTIGISLSAPFYPAIREAYERFEKQWVIQSIFRVVIIRLCVLLLPGAILIFFGDRLISFWMGQPLESHFGLLGWFAFLTSLLFVAISSTFSEILISLDVIWKQIKIVFLSAFFVLGGIYIGVPNMGLPAIFWAMAISTLIPIFWSAIKLKNQLNHISTR